MFTGFESLSYIYEDNIIIPLNVLSVLNTGVPRHTGKYNLR